ncbi:MAG TPA: MMPL family transporter, partial [Polyangiaceae bacterium]|nr:MMPL family transporter [Polyangiaceae bacterium]
MNSLRRLLIRLIDLQYRRPWLIVALALLTMIPSALAIRKLEIRTAFSELLPDDKPSVVELRRVNQRLPSASTLTVVAEAQQMELLKRFVDELTPKLRALPKTEVAAVDPGPREAQEFFEAHKLLYVPLADLESLHERVVEKYDREVQKRAGTDLGLDGDDAESTGSAPLLDANDLKQRIDAGFAKLLKAAPGQDGYYIGEGGKLAAIFVRTTLSSGDVKAFQLTEKIGRMIDSMGYAQIDPSFKYAFTGNLITSAEQYRAITNDLVSIGVAGVALVLMVVFVFFLRKRALFALGLSIVIGCAWSLSFAWLSIGHLNTATGFLISIIAGNGINAMVIWMARYLEARRSQQQGVREALETATLDTFEATLAVVAVSMVSYGALMTTGFRGFRHFGVIGGAGMLLCWLSAYGVLPAVLVLSERLSPLDVRASLRDRLAGLYGRPFAWLAKRYSAPVA